MSVVLVTITERRTHPYPRLSRVHDVIVYYKIACYLSLIACGWMGQGRLNERTPAQNDDKKLGELVERAETIVRELEGEQARWKAWGSAFAAGLRGDEATDAGEHPPIRIEYAKAEGEHWFWKGVGRVGPLVSMLAVIISVLGFIFTISQYQTRVEELNATTIYNLAREGRLLAADLAEGEATTGQAINFHFSVYYLQEKGVVEPSLRPLLLLDLCSLTKSRMDFEEVWAEVSMYYPENFRNAVDAITSLDECTRDALQGVAGEISVLGESDEVD